MGKIFILKGPFPASFSVLVFSVQNKQYIKDEPWLGDIVLVVVMGGDSCSRGSEFEYHDWILNRYFSYQFVEKIVLFDKDRK